MAADLLFYFQLSYTKSATIRSIHTTTMKLKAFSYLLYPRNRPADSTGISLKPDSKDLNHHAFRAVFGLLLQGNKASNFTK